MLLPHSSPCSGRSSRTALCSSTTSGQRSREQHRIESPSQQRTARLRKAAVKALQGCPFPKLQTPPTSERTRLCCLPGTGLVWAQHRAVTSCNPAGVQALQKQHQRLKIYPFAQIEGYGDPTACMLLHSTAKMAQVPHLGLGALYTVNISPPGQDAEAPSIPSGPCSGEKQQEAGATNTLRSTKPNQRPWRAIWDVQHRVAALARGRLEIQPRLPCPAPADAQAEHRSMGRPYGNHLLFSQSQSN